MQLKGVLRAVLQNVERDVDVAAGGFGIGAYLVRCIYQLLSGSVIDACKRYIQYRADRITGCFVLIQAYVRLHPDFADFGFFFLGDGGYSCSGLLPLPDPPGGERSRLIFLSSVSVWPSRPAIVVACAV